MLVLYDVYLMISNIETAVIPFNANRARMPEIYRKIDPKPNVKYLRHFYYIFIHKGLSDKEQRPVVLETI